MCIFRPVTELDVHFQAGEAPDVDVQPRGRSLKERRKSLCRSRLEQKGHFHFLALYHIGAISRKLLFCRKFFFD
jgi:hypothetical protein